MKVGMGEMTVSITQEKKLFERMLPYIATECVLRSLLCFKVMQTGRGRSAADAMYPEREGSTSACISIKDKDLVLALKTH